VAKITKCPNSAGWHFVTDVVGKDTSSTSAGTGSMMGCFNVCTYDWRLLKK